MSDTYTNLRRLHEASKDQQCSWQEKKLRIAMLRGGLFESADDLLRAAEERDKLRAEKSRLMHMLQDGVALVSWHKTGGKWTQPWESMRDAFLRDAHEAVDAKGGNLCATGCSAPVVTRDPEPLCERCVKSMGAG